MKNLAFTMAEILLSLTIIGVVAAITLPSLTGNINERTWNTQRKALYARFSQAIALMPSLNGYGTLTEESSAGASDGVDTAAETFVTAGLSKVLKINNICDSEHIEDCGQFHRTDRRLQFCICHQFKSRCVRNREWRKHACILQPYLYSGIGQRRFR